MQAIEATGTIDADGQLLLDQPLQGMQPGRVKIIILFAEPAVAVDQAIESPTFSPDVPSI